MKQNKKLYAFIGVSGSGKSFTSNAVAKALGYYVTISCTTREIRKGEIDGKDYYFYDEEGFLSKEMAEHIQFNGFHYGLEKEELFKGDSDLILVVEPNGILEIKNYIKDNNLDIDVVIIYMDTPKKIIRANLLKDLLEQDPERPLIEIKEEIEKRMSRGDIPGDFKKLGLTADLSLKQLNEETIPSVIEWIELYLILDKQELELNS